MTYHTSELYRAFRGLYLAGNSDLDDITLSAGVQTLFSFGNVNECLRGPLLTYYWLLMWFNYRQKNTQTWPKLLDEKGYKNLGQNPWQKCYSIHSDVFSCFVLRELVSGSPLYNASLWGKCLKWMGVAANYNRFSTKNCTNLVFRCNNEGSMKEFVNRDSKCSQKHIILGAQPRFRGILLKSHILQVS